MGGIFERLLLWLKVKRKYHKGKKYELEPTEIKRTAFKIAEKIRLAVINETGEEPVIELPTKKDIANLPWEKDLIITVAGCQPSGE